MRGDWKKTKFVRFEGELEVFRCSCGCLIRSDPFDSTMTCSKCNREFHRKPTRPVHPSRKS